MGSCNLSSSFAVSLLQQVITCPTLIRVSVGEINVLGVGRVTLDRRTATVSLLYHAGDMISEKCVKFVRAINHNGMVTKLTARNLTDLRAEHSAELAENLSVQALDLKYNKIGSTGAVSIFKALHSNRDVPRMSNPRMSNSQNV